MLKQSSLAGAAEYRTQSPLLEKQPHAVDILIDVLSDRGFRCTGLRLFHVALQISCTLLQAPLPACRLACLRCSCRHACLRT